jgi:hypothetical protein
MTNIRTMTKSPLALAREALAVAQEALAPYSSPRSRHDFTQAQLFSILVLREFFKTDHRGMVQLLKDFRDLRSALGLKKVPHFTTRQKAQQRLEKGGLASLCSTQCSSGRASWAWAFTGPLPWTPQGLRAATSAGISSSAAAG